MKPETEPQLAASSRRASAPRRGRIFYGWIIVVALGCSLVVSQGAALYLFGLLIVPITAELHWDRASLAAAFSISSFVLGVAGIPIGRIIDRQGPRRVMIIGSIGSALCLVGVARVHQLWAVYLLWGVGFGVAGALTSLQVASTTVANWFVRRRGRALAVMTTINGLTAPLYVPAASWLIVHTGWRTAVTLLGLIFLVVPLPLSFLLRQRPEQVGLNPDGDVAVERSEGKPAVTGFSFRDAMRHPAFWTLTLTSFFSATALGAVTVHQVAHMIGRGVSPILAGSVVGTLGLLSIPGRFFFNASGDWFGARRMVIAVIATQAIGLGILTAATTITWLFVYATIYGIAAGSAFGLRAALMADMFGRRAYGSIAAVFQLFLYTGTALGPIGAGILFDRFGNYTLAFTIATAMTAASLIGLVLLPRTSLEPAPRPLPTWLSRRR